jgi:hypothetical protein
MCLMKLRDLRRLFLIFHSPFLQLEFSCPPVDLRCLRSKSPRGLVLGRGANKARLLVRTHANVVGLIHVQTQELVGFSRQRFKDMYLNPAQQIQRDGPRHELAFGILDDDDLFRYLLRLSACHYFLWLGRIKALI